MSKTISITNDGDSPRYVMGRMIPPGETITFTEEETPPELRQEAEAAAPEVQDDPLLAWSAQGLAVALLCRAAGLDLSAWLAAGFYALAMVGGALSALPAGLGGTEAILLALLVGQGATLGTAVAVTVLVRLLTLWLAVALGLLALLYSVAIRKDISFR